MEYDVPLAEFDCRQLNDPAAQRIESGSLQVINNKLLTGCQFFLNFLYCTKASPIK